MYESQQCLRKYFSARAQFYEHVYAGKCSPFIRRWWRPLLDLRDHTLDSLHEVGGKRVLEIGCGIGELSAAMACRGATVVALDLSPEMIERAYCRAERCGVAPRIQFEVADFTLWQPAGDHQFDYVVAVGVFEYCRDPEAWLHSISSFGANLIATFPKPKFWLGALRRFNYFLKGRVPWRMYTEEGVRVLLANVGFRVARLDNLGVNFWVHGVH